MISHNEQIEAFKADFPHQLAAFMERRKDELGDAKDWKVRQINLSKDSKDLSQLYFKSQNNGWLISFVIRGLPDLLAPEETLALRKYINHTCKAYGFLSYRPRLQSLSSKILQDVKHGDSEAWAKFVGKHQSKFLSYADHCLGNGDNPSILEADDVVNIVLINMLSFFRRNPSSENFRSPNLNSMVQYGIFAETNEIPTYLRKESSGKELPEPVSPSEYNGQFETIAEQLPLIVDKAKERMSHSQQEILQLIMTSEEPLNLREISKVLGCTHENIRRHMNKLTKNLQKAAHNLGFEETATVIDYLMRVNSKGKTIRS